MEIELNRFTPAEQATFRLRALYEQAGYRKYRASRFEEYALYQEYQRFLPDAQVITFTDLDGKLRAIKPDVTLSIAKTAQPAAGAGGGPGRDSGLCGGRKRRRAARGRAWRRAGRSRSRRADRPAGAARPAWRNADRRPRRLPL